jgi:hypothetical protein
MSATVARPQARLPSPPSTAADVARSALVLLRTGRVAMASRVLETLPNLIERELIERTGQAALGGHRRGFNTLRSALLGELEPAPGSKPWLVDLCADPASARRAAEILGLDLATLDRLLADGVELSPTQRRRLRRGLGYQPKGTAP